MTVGRKRCTECGRTQEAPSRTGAGGDQVCPACGAPIDGAALSEFASRLARFGLGATRDPLLSRTPELPDAK